MQTYEEVQRYIHINNILEISLSRVSSSAQLGAPEMFRVFALLHSAAGGWIEDLKESLERHQNVFEKCEKVKSSYIILIISYP